MSSGKQMKGTENGSSENRKRGYSQAAKVDDYDIIIHTAEFNDGKLAGFRMIAPRGNSLETFLISSISETVSIALENGIELENFVEHFLGSKSYPAGLVTGNGKIQSATSILDYVFRELAITYLNRDDLAHLEQDRAKKERISIDEDIISSRMAHLILCVQAVDYAVNDLKYRIPNDPSIRDRYMRQVDEITAINEKLRDFAQRFNASKEIIDDKELDRIERIKDRFLIWLEENSDLIDSSTRVGISAIFIGIFGALGANMTVATPVILAVFGGKKMLDIIREIDMSKRNSE